MKLCNLSGQDSSVGIATRYGLDGPGIESRWGGERFSAPVHTGPGAHPASYAVGTGSFAGVKRPGRDIDHPPLSRAEVEGRVELYICSPSGPVLGWTLPLPFNFMKLVALIPCCTEWFVAHMKQSWAPHAFVFVSLVTVFIMLYSHLFPSHSNPIP